MERNEIMRRNNAIEWSRSVLANKDQYVIFDTETTGLKESDVIVHFAVMDLDGNMLIDTKVKPMSKRRMSQDATYFHGMTMKDLKDAPLFEEVVDMFRPISASKKLLSYNARFHAEMFEQTYMNEGVTGEPIRLDCWDVKDYYVQFSGQYNAALPGRKNTGVGDCMATLAVIRRMAEGEVVEIVDVQAENKDNVVGAVLTILAVVVFVFIMAC